MQDQFFLLFNCYCVINLLHAILGLSDGVMELYVGLSRFFIIFLLRPLFRVLLH